MRSVQLSLLAALSCLLLALPARAEDRFAIEVNARNFQPGELLVFAVDVSPPAAAVTVHLFDRVVAAYPLEGTRWQALFGVDLDQRPGTYTAVVEAVEGHAVRRMTRPVTIAPRRFTTRTLRVAPDYVNPPPETMARIQADQAFTGGIYAHPSAERLWSAPFVRPVPHAANSSFGTRSVFNGERRNPHAGTDFMSPAGTPVKAPNRGRIVCARDLFFTGNTVIIDHGLGMFSLMAHMSRLDVKEGDEVDAGQRIGLVGATGRVTGAHLHWAMAISGARVDPLSVLATLGK